MNTVRADRAGVHDDLASPEGLRDWLAVAGLPVGRPSDVVLARAVLLRNAARTLGAVSTGDGRPRAATTLTPDQALEALNATLLTAPPATLTLEGGQVVYARSARPTAGLAPALATLAVEAADLLGDAAVDLRACQAPGCVLYFVKDHPRRAWCSPGCGNRARAARHYAKQKVKAPGRGSGGSGGVSSTLVAASHRRVVKVRSARGWPEA